MMPVLVFLLDTSASMNQRTFLGTTALDLAKGAVETFLKLRARTPASRGDRYMLVSCDEPPATIKAGWKENHATFMRELKNIKATGLTNLGSALKRTFDLLNVNRLYSGIDNYGQGRNPFFLEPAMVIAITDGHNLTSSSGVQSELILPMTNFYPGHELTKEPFRWDQRLFALVLRVPGVPTTDLEKERSSLVEMDYSPINAMCEVTGGRSYTVTSLKTLNQCLESLVQKVKSGVVVNFEKHGPDPIHEVKLGSKSPAAVEGDKAVNGYLHSNSTSNDSKPSDAVETSENKPQQTSTDSNQRSDSPMPSSANQDTSWQSCRRLIYVRPNSKTGLPVGHWPIPESFWPDVNAPTLQPRDSQPILRFTCTDSEPLVLDNLPFDKYLLEPSPLTQYILERWNPNVGWQVHVASSGKSVGDLGLPFGYLKASSDLQSVNLVVMPYNYPVLLPLLDDLFKVHKLKPSIKWRQAFDNYLRDVPKYYSGPLRVALRRMGAPNLIPDDMENCLSYSVVTYLKKLKQQSKVEAEKLADMIAKRPKVTDKSIKVQPRSQLPSLATRQDFQQLLQAITGETITVRSDNNITEFPGFMLRVSGKDVLPQIFRNPFDVPRAELLDQVVRMRRNFLQLPTARNARLMNEDKLHNIPVAEMGNYQEYLLQMPSPLRDVEEGPTRLHTFGNPFKLASEKDKKMMVDEADVNEAMTGPQARRQSEDGSSPGKHGRRMGSILSEKMAKISSLQKLKKEAASLSAKAKKPPDIKITAELPEEGDLIIEEVLHLNGVKEETIKTNHVDPIANKELTKEPDKNMSDESGAGNKLSGGKIGSHKSSKPEVKSLKEKEEDHTQHNTGLRKLIVKEVRKPGKDFTKLFDFMSRVRGNLDVKYLFINSVIHEASRFKRRFLIQQLESYQQTVVQHEENNSSSSNKKRTLYSSNHVNNNAQKKQKLR